MCKSPIINWLLLMCVFTQSCIQKAGIEWKTLEKDYSSDKEKVEALHFLMNNMNDLISEIPHFYNRYTNEEIIINLENFQNEQELQLYINNHNIKSIARNERDTEILTTEAIKRTIDDSFQLWRNNTWKTKISKEMFFNYILPYKIYGERPENWRSYFYTRFQKVIQHTQQRTSNIDSKILEEEALKIDYNIYDVNEHALLFTSRPGLSELVCIKGGDCYSQAAKNIYLYRSLGLPAALDMTPQYGGGNAGHSTAVLWHNTTSSLKPKNEQGFNSDYRVAKVIRYSFAKTNLWSKEIKPYLQNINDFKLKYIQNNHCFDVTQEHTPTHDVVLPKPKGIDTSDIIYICTYTYGDWKPIWYAFPNNKDSVRFSNMGVDVLYRMAYYKKNKLYYHQDINLLDSTGKIIKVNRPMTNQKKNLSLSKINYGGQAWVAKGKSYTLQKLDNHGDWIDISTQIAQQDSSITFKNVPDNTYYLLRSNNVLKRLERPFTFNSRLLIWY